MTATVATDQLTSFLRDELQDVRGHKAQNMNAGDNNLSDLVLRCCKKIFICVVLLGCLILMLGEVIKSILRNESLTNKIMELLNITENLFIKHNNTIMGYDKDS